jgi:hypothetical protein
MAENGERVDQVLAEFMRRRDSGESLSPQDVIAAHPDVADELRSYFEMAELVDQAVVRVETQPTVDDSTIVTDATPTAPAPPGYEIRGELGRGGMGIVYRAYRNSTHSEVALKVLPPGLAADPLRLARFKQEAAAASKLTASHVLQIHDVIDDKGVPIIVMPLIEGATLGQILRQRREPGNADGVHPWAKLGEQEYLQAMLRVADQMTEAVAAIHEAGILHRDIKPSNVLIDRHGNAWLTDFGLSRFAEEQGLTVTGDMLGTRGYMSAEQAAGKSDIDFRADLFSLGTTIYESLTGALPYGKEAVSESTGLPPAPSRHQRLLSRDYDTVVLKAIEPDRRNRYASVQEFQQDWTRVRQGLLPTARRVGWVQRAGRWLRRNRWLAASAVLGIIVLLLGLQLLPERPNVYRVEVETDPPGARGVLVPIDPDTGEFVPERKILSLPSEGPEDKFVEFEDVLPGDYWLEVEVKEHGFHEVFRRVPDLQRGELPATYRHRFWKKIDEATVRVHEIEIPANAVVAEMVPMEGNPGFEAGLDDERFVDLSPFPIAIQRFYVDSMEASIGECLEVAVNHLVPKPARRLPTELAMSNVTYDQAVEYAERMGKRLPTEFEFEFAATNGGQSTFPWGDDRVQASLLSFGITPVNDHDVSDSNPAVHGLYSGVAEWTLSWCLPYPSAPALVQESFPTLFQDYRERRVVRGAPYAVLDGGVAIDPEEYVRGPRFRQSLLKSEYHPGLGFRCARSAKPKFLN